MNPQIATPSLPLPLAGEGRGEGLLVSRAAGALRAYTLTRRLVACPFPEPALADARTPRYQAPGDYAAMQALVHDEPMAPIHLSYGQYHRLLALIADGARALALDAPLLVEVARPLCVPLPPSLLQPDVLIADAIATELAFWLRHAKRGVLAVRMALRREAHEHGDNRLQLALWSCVHAADPLPALAATLGRQGAWQPVAPAQPLLQPTPAR